MYCSGQLQKADTLGDGFNEVALGLLAAQAVIHEANVTLANPLTTLTPSDIFCQLFILPQIKSTRPQTPFHLINTTGQHFRKIISSHAGHSDLRAEDLRSGGIKTNCKQLNIGLGL